MADTSNTARGYVEIENLGGRTRILRFRAHELAILEKRLDKPITTVLSEGLIGVNFLIQVLMVGTAHEQRGSKGKQAKISEQAVARWVDEYHDFGELMSQALEAVVLGLPGAGKAMAEEEEAQAAHDEKMFGDTPTDEQEDGPDVPFASPTPTDTSDGMPSPSKPSMSESA